VAGLFLVMALLAERPEAILERVHQAPLAADQVKSIDSSLAAKDYLRIETLLNAAARKDAAHAGDLYALLGAIEFVAGRMEPAAQAFRHSDSAAALKERDRFTLAMSLANLGDTAGARVELDTLNHLRPEQPLYLYWLARLDYYQRRYEDSIAKLRRVLELDPQSSRAEDNLGLALDMLGRSEEAQAEFAKAITLNRNLKPPSPWPRTISVTYCCAWRSWRALKKRYANRYSTIPGFHNPTTTWAGYSRSRGAIRRPLTNIELRSRLIRRKPSPAIL
jgi:tetratricopeptide (TPR) repeat protein